MDSERQTNRIVVALMLASRWLGDGDANETFEDIAEWFYRDTGMLRPGKDAPMSGHGPSDEMRREMFLEWADKKGAEVRKAVRDALDELRPEGGRVMPMDEPQYLIMDTRTVVGNTVMWWAPDGGGYVSDVEQAGRYPESKARKIEASRDTDLAVPVEMALRCARPRVDIQLLGRELDKVGIPIRHPHPRDVPFSPLADRIARDVEAKTEAAIASFLCEHNSEDPEELADAMADAIRNGDWKK